MKHKIVLNLICLLSWITVNSQSVISKTSEDGDFYYFASADFVNTRLLSALELQMKKGFSASNILSIGLDQYIFETGGDYIYEGIPQDLVSRLNQPKGEDTDLRKFSIDSQGNWVFYRLLGNSSFLATYPSSIRDKLIKDGATIGTSYVHINGQYYFVEGVGRFFSNFPGIADLYAEANARQHGVNLGLTDIDVLPGNKFIMVLNCKYYKQEGHLPHCYYLTNADEELDKVLISILDKLENTPFQSIRSIVFDGYGGWLVFANNMKFAYEATQSTIQEVNSILAKERAQEQRKSEILDLINTIGQGVTQLYENKTKLIEESNARQQKLIDERYNQEQNRLAQQNELIEQQRLDNQRKRELEELAKEKEKDPNELDVSNCVSHSSGEWSIKCSNNINVYAKNDCTEALDILICILKRTDEGTLKWDCGLTLNVEQNNTAEYGGCSAPGKYKVFWRPWLSNRKFPTESEIPID